MGGIYRFGERLAPFAEALLRSLIGISLRAFGSMQSAPQASTKPPSAYSLGTSKSPDICPLRGTGRSSPTASPYGRSAGSRWTAASIRPVRSYRMWSFIFSSFLWLRLLHLDGGETQQANIWTSNAPHRDIKDSDLVQVIIRRRDQSCHLCGIVSLKGSNTEPPLEVSVAMFPRPPDGCSFLQDRVAPELGNGSHKTPPWFVTVYGECDLIFGTGRSLPVQTLTNNVSSRSKSTNTAFDSSTRNSRHKRASSIVSLAQATKKVA